MNEVSRRKSTARAKLKAAIQEVRIHLWKEHFKNLLGKSPKVKDELFATIISGQINIKLVEFMLEELDIELRKVKNQKKKVPVLMQYPQKYGKQGHLTTYRV